MGDGSERVLQYQYLTDLCSATLNTPKWQFIHEMGADVVSVVLNHFV